VRWSRATPDRCDANSRQGKGRHARTIAGLGEPERVCPCGTMDAPTAARSLKIFERVALLLRHLAGRHASTELAAINGFRQIQRRDELRRFHQLDRLTESMNIADWAAAQQQGPTRRRRRSRTRCNRTR
jgi:hypothetical protein